MNREFYDLCYDQYKIELEEAEKLYQKVSILFILIPILGSVSVKIGRADLLNITFERVDVFIYYCSFLVAWILLTISIFFAILCVRPRKDYQRIGNMDGWQDWHVKYNVYLQKNGKDETVDEALMRDIF